MPWIMFMPLAFWNTDWEENVRRQREFVGPPTYERWLDRERWSAIARGDEAACSLSFPDWVAQRTENP